MILPTRRRSLSKGEQEAILRIGSLIGRLAYTSSLCDPSVDCCGAVAEPTSASGKAPRTDEVDGALRSLHERVFLDWLRCGLAEQWADLEFHLRDIACDPLQWIRAESYRSLIPRTALEPERLLFLCDFDALSALICCRHGAADPRVARALEWLTQDCGRLGAGLTLKGVARRLRLSAGRLRQLFRKGTGYAFHRYAKTIRIRAGAELLLWEPPRTVAEIASTLGYSDTSNFVRDFRSRLGETPGQFRAKGSRIDISTSAAPDSESGPLARVARAGG
ncbi:MAG: helix-turn-helix transcriptional regulator [Bryobacteraceae bacterium]